MQSPNPWPAIQSLGRRGVSYYDRRHVVSYIQQNLSISKRRVVYILRKNLSSQLNFWHGFVRTRSSSFFHFCSCPASSRRAVMEWLKFTLDLLTEEENRIPFKMRKRDLAILMLSAFAIFFSLQVCSL